MVLGKGMLLGLLRLIVIRYIAYLAMAAAALQNMKRTDHVRVADNEEQELEEQEIEELEDRYSMEYRQIISHSFEHRTSLGNFSRIGTAV